MNLTNESYVILIGTKNFVERYYRDEKGWVKVSARGRTFRATAEQVLNHVMPAIAGIKPNVTIRVERQDSYLSQMTPKLLSVYMSMDGGMRDLVTSERINAWRPRLQGSVALFRSTKAQAMRCEASLQANVRKCHPSQPELLTVAASSWMAG